MARILVQGTYATVELTMDDDGFITATCDEHTESDGRLFPPGNCSWTRNFGTWADALNTPDIEGHADTGDQR